MPFLFTLLTFILASLLGAAAAFAQTNPFGGGAGTEGNPYQISTIAHLNAIRDNSGSSGENYLDDHFILMNDLDFTSYAYPDDDVGTVDVNEGWLPIGHDTEARTNFQGTAFSATFDGDGHVIRNFLISRADEDYVGLFGVLQFGAFVKNLGVEGVNVGGKASVGGLVGESNQGKITSCYSTGSVTGMGERVGGLVGRASPADATITSCYSTADVTGSNVVGGLVGGIASAAITSCYSTGSVTGSGTFIGGFLGLNGLFGGAFATGPVSGSYWENADAVDTDVDTTDRTPTQMQALTLADLGDPGGLSWTVGTASQYPALRTYKEMPAGTQVQGDVIAGQPCPRVECGPLVSIDDLPLTFMSPSVEAQSYTKDVAIPGLTLPAAMGGAGPYTYTLTPVPAGLMFDDDPASRTLSGTPTEAATATYTYTVTDSTTGTQLTTFLTFTITVGEPLTFMSPSVEAQAYTKDVAIPDLTLPAAMGGAGPYTYTLAPLPMGLTFNDNPATRTLSGTPTEAATATYTYTVTDSTTGTQLTTFLTFTITVGEPLTFMSPSVEAQAYTKNTAIPGLTLPAAMGGTGPYTYTLVPVPAGLSFDDDPASRTLSGTPDATQALTEHTYTVTDSTAGTQLTTFLTFTITVGDLPEVSIAAGTSSVTEGTAAEFTLTRTGSTAAELTVAVTVTGGDGFLSGTAPVGAVFAIGEATVTISLATAVDEVDEADGTVTVTITAAASKFRLGTATATVDIADDDLPFGGGDGTEGDPYQISTIEHLNAIRDNSGSSGENYLARDLYFALTSDLDFLDTDGSGVDYVYSTASVAENDKGWLPIGHDTEARTGFQGTRFTGSFDGAGHGILNLLISRANEDHVGLFGFLGSAGSVKNLGVEGVNVRGKQGVGGLVGSFFQGTITSCYSTGSVTGMVKEVGGLVGSTAIGTITSCYSTASVTGSDKVGGLVGVGTFLNITSCYSTGSVTGTGSGTLIGGFLGERVEGTVSASYWENTGIDDATDDTDRTPTQMRALTLADLGDTGGLSWAVGTENQYPALRTYKEMPAGTQVQGDVIAGQPCPRAGGCFPFEGGLGTEGDPYRISTIEHLNAIRGEYLDDHFLLTTDLDFENTDGSGADYVYPDDDVGTVDVNEGWLPIGHDTDAGRRRFQGTGFSGSFDGAGRVIRNLRIDRRGEDYVGLFGFSPEGSIVSLGLEDLEVTGGERVGGLVGSIGTGGTVTGSYATGSVTGDNNVGGLVGSTFGPVTDSYATGSVTGDQQVGGLVGSSEFTTVMGSYATGSVTGDDNVGGLMGHFGFGTVTGSYATGSVTGDNNVGGLVGLNLRNTVTGSYATGSVTGDNGVGGLVGDNNSGTVTGSYATGSVTGDLRVGGLVGRNTDTVTGSYATGSVTGGSNVGGLVGEDVGTVTDSYWNTQLSGQDMSAGGETGLTTAEMFIQGSFAGFDFTGTAASGSNPEVLSVWKLPVLGVSFPHLREVSKNGQVLSIPRIKVILGLGPFSLVPTFFPPTITEAPVFSSDPDTVATIDPSSGEITLAAGAARGDEVTITVRRGGDSIYSSVIGSQVLQVTMAQTVTISEGSTLSKAFGDLPFTLTAIADTTSGLSDFTWVSSNSGVVTVTGGSTATVTVMLVGVGMTTLTVQEPGDEDWEPGEASVTLTVTKGMQLVSVTPGPSLTRTFGTDTSLNLTVTGDSDSGLTNFTWSSSAESVATVSSAGLVTIMGAGVSVIMVRQPGNENWEPGEASVTLTVNKGTQTPSGGMLLTKAFGEEFTLTAVADTASGLSAFTWGSSNTGIATVTTVPGGTMATVTLVGVGVTTLTAREPGNGNWEAGMTEWTLTVTKGMQLVSVTPGPSLTRTFGTDTSLNLTVTGDSDSGLTNFTWSSSAESVATVSLAGEVTIKDAGVSVITVREPGNENWEPGEASVTLTVNKGTQTPSGGMSLTKAFGEEFTLTAVADTASGLSAFTWGSSNTGIATVTTVGGGTMATVTLVGVGVTTLTAREPGNGNWEAGMTEWTLTVTKGTQAPLGGEPLTKAFGEEFTLTAVADTTSGLSAFTWESSDTGVATVPGGTMATVTVTLVGVGMTTLTAREPGNEDWEAGMTQWTLEVTKGTQAPLGGEPLTKAFGEEFTLAAVADTTSGLSAFTWESSETGVATVPGGTMATVTVTLVGVGVTTLTAREPGNLNWKEGMTQWILTVSKGVPQISGFPESREVPLLPATFALGGTSSSGVPVTYSVPNTDVITISGVMATITGSGIVVVTATVSATANWEGVTQQQTLTVADKMGQTLTFASLPEKSVGDLPFSLSATSSEPSLTDSITFSSSDESVATVAGSTVTLVGAGMTDIRATQAGSAEFVAASVVQMLTVTKGTQAPLGGESLTKAFGDLPFTLTAVADTTSGLSAFTWESSDTGVATVPGGTMATVTVTLVGVGMTTLTAREPGNEDWEAGMTQWTLEVTKGTQAPLGGEPLTKAFGEEFTLAAVADTTSGLSAFTWESSETGVATVPGGTMATVTVTLVGVGVTTLTAREPGNLNWKEGMTQWILTVSKGVPQISGFPESREVPLLPATFALGGTSSSGVPVTYSVPNTDVITISGVMATITGSGIVVVTATVSATANWEGVTQQQTLTVADKMGQTLTFASLPEKSVGDLPFSLSATSSEPSLTDSITFSSSDESVATVAGSTVTLVGAGMTDIRATQAGSAEFVAASVVQMLTVTKGTQAPLGGESLTKAFGDLPFTLTAVSDATSGLSAFEWESSDTGVATVPGGSMATATVTLVGVGMTTLTAREPGNLNWTEGMTQWILTVSKGVPQISGFPENREVSLVPATFALGGTSSSGVPITYSVPNTDVITISGDMATITGSGIVVVTATVSATANWEGVTRQQTLTVADKMGQTLTFASLPEKSVGDLPFSLSATSSEPSLTDSITFSSSDESVATVAGSTVTLVGAGMTNITATQAGSAEFVAASVVQTLTVTKGTQTPSGGMPLSKTFGDSEFMLTAVSDVTSGLSAFEWVSSDTGVATVPVGSMATVTVTLEGAGMTTLTAREPGNDNWEEGMTEWRLTVLKGASQISGFPESREVPLVPATFALGGTSSSGETITYSVPNTDVITISGDMATIIDQGTVEVTATVLATANWEGVTQRQALTVADKMGQTLTFAPLPDKLVGDSPFLLSATSSESSLTSSITFSSSDESVATVSGSTVTLVGSGMTDITATQAGSAEFVAASVVQTLHVFLPVLTFGSEMIPSRNYLQGTLITPLSLPEATGGTGPYTYTLDPVPAGLSFDDDPASRTLSGTPDATQALTEHTYTVTDSAEPVQTATLTFTITVLEAGTLTFMSPVEAQTYTKDVEIEPLTLPEAIGGMGPYTYTLVPEPAGLSFDDDPASRTLSGTPDATQAMTEHTYTVTDSAEPAQTATLTFTITVIEVGTLTFMPPSVEAQTYTQDVEIEPLTLPEATGGTGPYTYTLTPVPAGLMFDDDPASRTLSGTPDATQALTGHTYTVTDSATGTSLTASLTFTITVIEALGIGSQEAAVHVYPNPASDVLHIEFPGADEYGIALLTLTGKPVFGGWHAGGGFKTLDVSTLKRGVYLLKIEDNEGVLHIFRIIR